MTRPRPSMAAATQLFSRLAPGLKDGSYLVKFSKRQYVEEMLISGRFRISPALAYKSDLFNAAIRDDESVRETLAPYGTKLLMKVDGEYKEITGISGAISFKSKRCENFYVFCASGRLDPRLFSDFEADACLVVRNLQEFGFRLTTAVASSTGCSKQAHRSVYYDDPCHTRPEKLPVEFVKHCRYEYQKEWRIAWRCDNPIAEDAPPVFVDLGPLDDCCEAHYL